MIKIIDKAIAENEFRPGDSEMLAKVFLAGMEGSILFWSYDTEKVNVRRIFDNDDVK